MIAIVTDSTAGLTRQEAKDLGVVCIPMTYTVAGTVYAENFLNENGDFERFIAAGGNELHTSQASIGSYMKAFASLRSADVQVLCLTISSRLSGTFSNASVCARELGGGGIRVVDSHTTAGGLLILIRQARRMLDQGYSLDQTAQAILAMRSQIETWFSVADMAPLRRSGRLGPVRQSVGTILNLRPLLSCREGAVVSCGMAHGKAEQLRGLAKNVPPHAKDILVEYISEKDSALRLAKMLEEKCVCAVPIRRVGPVLGIHLGLDVISAIWRDPEK